MILVENLSLRAGTFTLERIHLEVPSRAYAILMGKTGSGKTTLLESIAGLTPIHAGRIVLAGVDVTNQRPAQRGIGYVPQDGALFANMTVAEHLEFALLVRRFAREVRRQRVAELAEWLDLGPLLGRLPARLSGGERQRVALGRALSFRPKLLLLDEPLSALDDETRQQTYDVLRRMRQHSPVTTLHVTHNREDADQLGDVVFQLADGKIAQSRALET